MRTSIILGLGSLLLKMASLSSMACILIIADEPEVPYSMLKE